MPRFISRARVVDVGVVLFAIALPLLSKAGALPFSLLESLGFATGALSVWLVVHASPWTWPVGIANNVFFIFLFFDARLFADMALQFGYIALSIAGWWYWLRGDAGRPRRIEQAGPLELLAVLALVGVATVGLTVYLRSVNDSAPFLDALTTCLSIGATYLMARKLIESWFVWIAADLIYIPLYAWKDLGLTAILYGVFLAMCVRGLFTWRARLPRYREAVVAGKFYPFHAGHKFLIGEAFNEARNVTVLVCQNDEETITGDVRADWIGRAFPAANVVVVDQTALGLADDDSWGWATATVAALGRQPDVVFSSEDYGDAYAAAMGAAHHLVDRDRTVVPISGTAIRRDPLAHLDQLDPNVRAHYVKRVCILGAESTGKTMLAALLARRYETVWVPEYGREYSERYGKKLGDRWESAEFAEIAREQAAREDRLAEQANRVLFCDTDVFTTARFHEAYTGRQDPQLERVGRSRRYDLYFLCALDAPFVQDGWRDDGPHRVQMDAAYRQFLAATNAPWVELSGPYEQRLDRAESAVDLLLAGSAAA